MSRLLILTGPSGIGKSPLLAALRRHYPALAAQLQPLVLYNDRLPRPGEQDGVTYYFRSRAEIERLREKPGYIVLPVRQDLQALELAQIYAALEQGRWPIFEGNVYIAQALLEAPELSAVRKLSCFLSPLSLAEIQFLQSQPHLDLARLVANIMRRKLLRRATKQKGLLGLPDLQEIEARCGAAFAELQYAPRFDWILPNHDGEDSEHWEAFYYPLGDARRCLLCVAALLRGEEPDPQWAEHWPADLFSQTT